MEYIKIPLVGKHGYGKYTLVDGDYDGEYFSGFRWYLLKCGYVARKPSRYENRGNEYIYLHHEVQKSYNGLVRDHINRDKLDNRSCNLRLVTPSENRMNSNDYNNKRLSREERLLKMRYYANRPEYKLKKREYDMMRYTKRKSGIL